MSDSGLPTLVCPCCRVPLSEARSEWRCSTCGRSYPVIGGIPDLRVASDRYLSLDEDRAKAARLAATPGGFADAVRAYWAMTPEVPERLADRYLARALEGESRALPHLEALGLSEGTVLDVGCGSGGLVVAAARRGLGPVGVDLALRWLVIAQRALTGAGMDAPLVAADGALLPFAPGSFDGAVCIETLEHTQDQRGLLDGCRRVVRDGGVRYLVTANRLSLAPEPVSGLMGVGYLPRRLAAAYVRRRTGTRYQFFRAVSPSELRSWCGLRSGLRVGAAVLPAPPHRAPVARRGAQTAYEQLRGVAPFSAALGWIAPYLEVRDA